MVYKLRAAFVISLLFCPVRIQNVLFDNMKEVAKMAETLSGNISEMSLLQILKMLNSGKMSGCLAVTNSVTDGEIYVNNGEIVHCSAGSSVGEIALLNMLGWIEGRFRFETNSTTSQQTIEKDTQLLLQQSESKTSDWRKIKTVVHSMNMVPELAPGGNPSGVNLKPMEWEIITQINGVRTVSDIVDLTGNDEFEIAKTIYNLILSGLIQEKATHRTQTTNVTTSFFETLEQELIDAIGPMASIIIDEAIEKFGADRSVFPGSKVPALVEKVSLEIKDEAKRLNFSQNMIRSLNEF
ncbi:DUF4388 domain-containing protein [candidate division KSB1 bacterium]|nr:DUF4388 domain-containing protein [candidate division KSB1 bacterium]